MTSAYVAALTIGLACVAVGCRQETPKAVAELPISRGDAENRTSTSPMAPRAEAAAPQGSGAEVPAKAAADATLAARVKAELLKDSEGRSIEIHVESHDGVVRLSGNAPSYSDIDRAVEVARRIDGVRSVKQQLAVKTS